MKTILLAAILFTALSVTAQSDEDSIKSTIQHFFAGMKNADTVLLKSTLAKTAILHTVAGATDQTIVKDEKISEFVAFVGKQNAGDADEQIEFETLKTDGILATVWTPYKFYYKGNFSHCGVNSFQLVKLDSGWKIQYIIDTRRKTGCL